MKKILFVIMNLMLAFASTACIEDGPLPANPTTDAGVVPSGACAGKTSGTECREPAGSCDQAEFCDGMSNDCPANQMEPAGTVCLDSSNVEGTCSGTSTSCHTIVVVGPVSPILPEKCHGLFASFSLADVISMDYCTGWTSTGLAMSLTPAMEVEGGKWVCAITCNKKVTGETIVPNSCSGVWLSDATDDVPRWITPGCKRLPDHPAAEPNQAGCTWDKRCDLY